MSWLASMKLGYEQVAKNRLSDAYRWHQAVWKSFPGINGDRDTQRSKRTAFLYRVISRQEDVELLILSRIKPELPPWCPEHAFRLTEIKPSFLSYSHYLFDIYANPTRKVKKTDGKGNFTKHGKRLPLLQPDQQRDWLGRKANECGFILSAHFPVEIIPGHSHTFFRNGNRGLHIGVQYKGMLEVKNHDLFSEAFLHGIGSAKSFGFGMLMIKPVPL